MDRKILRQWKDVKFALEHAEMTDSRYYRRACEIIKKAEDHQNTPPPEFDDPLN